MIVFAMMAIYFALVATYIMVAATSRSTAEYYRVEGSKNIVNNLNTAISNYSYINGKLPTLTNAAYSTSLQQLANTQGFEYLKGYIATSKGGTNYLARDLAMITSTPDYSSSTALVNSINTVQTGSLIYDNDRTVDLTKYTASSNNVASNVRGCTGDAKDISVSDSYCAKYTTSYQIRYTAEPSANFSNAADRLMKIADKFEAVYKNSATVPGTTGSTIVLNASVVNTSGGQNATNATNCTGVFLYNNVPLSCPELYLDTNKPVSYTKLANNQIRLTVANFYYDKNRTLQSYSIVRTF